MAEARKAIEESVQGVSTDDLQRRVALALIELVPRIVSIGERIFRMLVVAAFAVGVFFATTYWSLDQLKGDVAKIEAKVSEGTLPVSKTRLDEQRRRIDEIDRTIRQIHPARPPHG